MKPCWRNVVPSIIAGSLLLVACGNAIAIEPLQSAITTPTLPIPPTAIVPPTGATQTPIVLATATLGGQPATTAVLIPTAPAAATSRVLERPSATPPPSATPLPSPTIDLTEVFGPRKTPNSRATSQAVILTITALAVPPTLPPTDTPRPRRTPVIIGAGGSRRVPATSDPRTSGIKVRTVSPQVAPGGAAALSIQAPLNSTCALQIARTGFDGSVSLEPIAGSARQSAGRDGGVAWIWTVDADEPVGSMSLIIDCGEAGAQQLVIPVTK